MISPVLLEGKKKQKGNVKCDHENYGECTCGLNF